MNKKKSFYMWFVISILVFLFVSIRVTFSKFTAISDTFLSLNLAAIPIYTYYFQVPPDWESENVYSYMWGTYNNSVVQNAAYPGIQMECVDSTKKIYKYTLSAELAYKTYGTNVFENIVFSNGETADQARYGKKTINQTVVGDINGKIFVPEIYVPEDNNHIRVVCYGYEPCYIYRYGSAGDNGGWPGEKIAASNNVSDSAYKKILDKTEYDKLIFNNNGSSQTENLNYPVYQDLTCVIKGNKKSAWRRMFYFGSWKTYSEWNLSGYTNWTQSSDYSGFQSTIGYNKNNY